MEFPLAVYDYGIVFVVQSMDVLIFVRPLVADSVQCATFAGLDLLLPMKLCPKPKNEIPFIIKTGRFNQVSIADVKSFCTRRHL